MQRYLISSWNEREFRYQSVCSVDAESQQHAIVKAYRFGALRRDQVWNARAEITESQFLG
jgi:hypothetical protein